MAPHLESVGALVDGTFVELSNTSPTPEVDWELSDRDSATARRAEVFFHSHPPGFPWPSERDLRQQCAMGEPVWCIYSPGSAPFYFGQGVYHGGLEGRPYRFGVTDCYGIVRDLYAAVGDLYQAGHRATLREYPRAWGYDDRGEDLYHSHFAEEGFRIVPEGLAGLRPFDVLLLQIRSKVRNHAVVYMGKNTILHHPAAEKPFDPTHLSRIEPMARWARFAKEVLRRD